ncbi:MAG: hypothetical protein LBQ02_03705 [Candidatus Nomurabacteria bacterium]|jgi:hypothetical protein|nr:hypothetical protein [Candidatus Nomurabacteria bacterium]
MNQLLEYFTNGVKKTLPQGRKVGMEIETQFSLSQPEHGNLIPAPISVSQRAMRQLAKGDWEVRGQKGDFISSIGNSRGDLISYELGRHNMEVSTAPQPVDTIIAHALHLCQVLEQAMTDVNAGVSAVKLPVFPEWPAEMDAALLAIPDARDANWVKLDGIDALAPLALISSVQFTVDITPDEAIPMLNRLGSRIDRFLADFPQEKIWHDYIRGSKAKYQDRRYGGKVWFDSMKDYCNELSQYDVVENQKMVPFYENGLDIPLFVRSVWWYFRLKRYGDQLCIEVRPFPRRQDYYFAQHLEFLRQVMQF